MIRPQLYIYLKIISVKYKPIKIMSNIGSVITKPICNNKWKYHF